MTSEYEPPASIAITSPTFPANPGRSGISWAAGCDDDPGVCTLAVAP